MSEITEVPDKYRQQIIDNLLAAESTTNDAKVNEARNRHNPRPQNQASNNIDPIEQVMKNKLQEERQENRSMDAERSKITENIRTDIIEDLIK